MAAPDHPEGPARQKRISLPAMRPVMPGEVYIPGLNTGFCSRKRHPSVFRKRTVFYVMDFGIMKAWRIRESPRLSQRVTVTHRYIIPTIFIGCLMITLSRIASGEGKCVTNPNPCSLPCISNKAISIPRGRSRQWRPRSSNCQAYENI